MENETIFKPCPLCGAELTTKDIRIFDTFGEGGLIRGTRGGHFLMYDGGNMHPDAVESVVIACGCGFSFWARARAVNFCKDGWLGKFAEEANRRA